MKIMGFGDKVRGWTFLASLFSFFGGIQRLSIGIIGEFIAKIFVELKIDQHIQFGMCINKKVIG